MRYICSAATILALIFSQGHAIADNRSTSTTNTQERSLAAQHKLDAALPAGAWSSVSKFDARQLIAATRDKSTQTTLNVEGEQLSLEFEKLVTPEYGGVIHWVGRVRGEEGSHVRFTISSSAFFSTNSNAPTEAPQIAGELTRNGSTIRLRSGGGDRRLLMYESSGESLSGVKLSAPTRSKRTEQANRLLEAQGLRFDRLKNADPESYSIGRRGILTTLWGESAAMLKSPEFKDERSIGQLMGSLGPLLPFIGSERLEFMEKGGSDDQVYYDYRQSIGGIPVLDSNVRVFVARDSGAVLGVNSTVFPDIGYEPMPTIAQASAIEQALSYLRSDPNMADYTPITMEAKLAYLSADVTAESAIRLAWSVEMTDGQLAHWVLMDANTGEIIPTISVAADDVRVCERNDNNVGAQTGHPYYTCKYKPAIWDGNGNCADAARCQQPQYKVPNEVARENIAIWKGNIGSSCCGRVGNGGLLDIVSNSQLSTDFYPATIPAGSAGAYVSGNFAIYQGVWIYTETIGLDPIATDNPEVVAHEMGHAIYHAENGTAYGLGSQGTLSTKRENTAVREAIADINALIHENAQHSPPYSSPDWTTGGRDMSVKKIYPGDMVITNNYESGRIMGYAFYKLVTDNNGVNFQTAGKIFHKSLSLIQDSNNSKGISFEEVRRAMVQAATTQAQKNAVNAAFQAAGIVYTPPGGGSGSPSGPPSGGSGTVSAPGYVNGSVSVACSDFISYHNNHWGSSSGASLYDVYYSVDSLIFQYGFTSAATSASTYNTVDVWVKVSSCNGSGCSVLSTDSYFQDYLCN